MGGGGVSLRTFDVVRNIQSFVFNAFNNSRPKICTAPSDSRVLRMHYQWTAWLMLTGFASAFYAWFYKDIITCVSHFNAEVQVRLDYLNICLSYPFVIEEDGTKQHLLFYRWIHWVFLLLAIAFFIPRKLSKKGENPKVKKLFEDLAGMNNRLDANESQIVANSSRFIVVHNRSNNGLYYRYVAWHFVALLIDILAFVFLDMLLLNRFALLVPKSFPFKRDGEFFKDYISKTFPPFVKCDVGPWQQLVNERTERFGCHLLAMELYEKLFIVVWLWLIILMVITSLYISYMLLFFYPRARNLFLRFSKPFSAESSVSETIEKVSQCSQIGDWFLLYKIRQHFSPLSYYRLMKTLSDKDARKAILNAVRDEQQNKKILRCSEKSTPHKGFLIE